MSSTPDFLAAEPAEFADRVAVSEVADERQLELLVRDWRKGRATRSLGAALSDAYVGIFAAVMIIAMLVNVIIRAQSMASSCSSQACVSGRGLLPWAALCGVLALALAAARMFGPVLASAAEGFWLMDAPIRRSRLLVRRLVAAVAIALVAGAGLGALVAALTGSSASEVLVWTGATGLGAAGLVAFAAAEQGAERTWTVRLVHALVSAAGIVALLAVISTSANWFRLAPTHSQTMTLAGIVGLLGLVLAIGAGVLARARLNRIRRARLLSGGSLASGMQGAMFALDLGLMRDILVEREALARGSVRPTRGRGLGTTALVWRDVQRLVRFPKPLVLLAVSVVVPYAVQALGLGVLNVTISAIVLMGALIPFFGTLRVLSRTKGLARSMPMSTSQLRGAATIVPAVLAGLWCLAVAPAFWPVEHHAVVRTLLVALCCAVAGLVAAIRWVTAKSADYSGPMLSTSMGAMPPGTMFNLLRGFDMVALVSLPIVFGLSPWISLVIAGIAFTILRSGGLDAERLQEEQEQQRRQLAQMQSERRGQSGATQKQVVTRKKR